MLSGVPSFFIRTSGCNLRCTWCDTPYASWNAEGAQQSLGAIVAQASASNVGHIVITGGEPMLHDAIEPLSQSLRDINKHITIETAGTIHRSPDRLACDLLSLSPKLSNSTPSKDDPRDPSGSWNTRHDVRRLPLDILQRLIDDYPVRQMKFVVAHLQDLDEIDELLGQLTNWQPHEILLMPEGVKVPEPSAIKWIVDACIARGWRFCPRLHIALFGNTRGT